MVQAAAREHCALQWPVLPPWVEPLARVTQPVGAVGPGPSKHPAIQRKEGRSMHWWLARLGKLFSWGLGTMPRVNHLRPGLFGLEVS